MPNKDLAKHREYQRAWEARPENKAKRKAYWAKNAVEFNEKARLYRIANKERIAERDRLRRGRLGQGICDICKNSYKVRCKDHCHTTGLLRGALCVRCNFLLGYSLDNPSILQTAIEYLAYWKEQHENSSK